MKRVPPTLPSLQFKKYALYMGMKHRQRKNNLGKKRKHKDEYNLVDRLTESPDDVLVSILSLLSLKEAATTSILSRRWRYVWASTMALDFDAKFFDDEVYPNFLQLQPALREQESLRYVNWVNHVVEQHRGPSIERFRVSFDIDSRFASSIDKWIQFAMNKRVQILELDLHLCDFFTRSGAYSFPHTLLGLGKESVYPSPHSCQYNIGFEFLKVLHLQFVDVTGEVLEHFLYNCPVLERLTVSFATKSLVKLGVVGPSIALKYLTIKWCKLESIEIRDVKLVSFIYEGNATNLLLNNVPFLVEVSVSEGLVSNFLDEVYVYCKSIELPFTQLSCCLSQLEIFMLDIDLAVSICNYDVLDFFFLLDYVVPYNLFGFQVYNRDCVFPVLANVKHLELTVKANYDMDLFHLTSFMKASPLLQRLVLKLNFTTLTGKGQIKSAGECPHHYLKVLEIVGYRAHTCVVQHVMHLIKSAVALEKIIIHPVQRLNEYFERVRGVEKVEEAKARDHAMQCLREKVPSTIEFVCL